MKDSIKNANNALNKAKIAQHDEFFTKEIDVKKEIFYDNIYKDCFVNKTVLCNCNDTKKSGFERFFKRMFRILGLKELITISYNPEKTARMMRFNGKETTYSFLIGNGDYKSDECIDLLNQSDIVCTNPPFSEFLKFIGIIIEHKKDFLVIGNVNEMICNSIFPLFKSGQIWYGQNQVKIFNTIDGEKKFGNIGWYTNMGKRKEPKPIEMTESYISKREQYPKYDNFNAIDVGHLKDIPYDFFGAMGVPGTYLLVHNPKQFELIGPSGYLAEDEKLPDGTIKKNPGRFYINGKRLYDRIVIKRKCV